MTPDELKARTKDFAVAIVRFCRMLPRDSQTQEIATQLVDAGTGVGSNYRSVCRARSRADFINKLGITLDCADESAYWLDVLIESETAATPAAKGHLNEAEQLTRILAKSRDTARRNRGNDGWSSK